MSLLARIRQLDFLASEFLTWLLYRCERQNAVWKLDASPAFELWPDDRLRLEAPVDGVTKNLLSGGTPSRTAEAHAALATGKLVQEARWKLLRGEKEWLFTMKAPDLDLRSVRLPELLTEEEDDRLRERLSLMRELEETVELLLKTFLELRLSNGWTRDELPAVSEWILDGTPSNG